MSNEINEQTTTNNSNEIVGVENTELPKENAGEGRDEQGRWIKGVSGNPEGMEKWTEEQKLKKKAQKELIEEYKQGLIEALSKISPVLVDKALTGDIQAIKEINDRAMGKAPQSVDMTSNGETIFQITPEIATKNGINDNSTRITENNS